MTTNLQDEKVEICAACPVQLGVCPVCLTFWIDARASGGAPGKRHGVRRVDGNPLRQYFDEHGFTAYFLHQLSNFVERPSKTR